MLLITLNKILCLQCPSVRVCTCKSKLVFILASIRSETSTKHGLYTIPFFNILHLSKQEYKVNYK